MYTYIYIHIYLLPRRRLFSILIAPKMAPNKCKLCLHTNLKLKCNLKKCFKMHFRACWQSFLWLSELTLRIRTGGGINIRIHASCIHRLTQRFICALSLSRLFPLIFYNLPSKQFHAFCSENKKMCTMCKSVMNFSAVGAYKRNGQGAQRSPAHNYTMAYRWQRWEGNAEEGEAEEAGGREGKTSLSCILLFVLHTQRAAN